MQCCVELAEQQVSGTTQALSLLSGTCRPIRLASESAFSGRHVAGTVQLAALTALNCQGQPLPVETLLQPRQPP